jgi:hypothetical protein
MLTFVRGMLIIKIQAVPVLRKGSSVLEGSGGPLVKRSFYKPSRTHRGGTQSPGWVLKGSPGGPAVPEEQE